MKFLLRWVNNRKINLWFFDTLITQILLSEFSNDSESIHGINLQLNS